LATYKITSVEDEENDFTEDPIVYNEGVEENEENNSTNEGAEDGEAAVFPSDIDIEVDGDTKEVQKTRSINSP